MRRAGRIHRRRPRGPSRPAGDTAWSSRETRASWLCLSDCKKSRANEARSRAFGHFNSVAVGEAAGLGDAAPVQVGAIGATQVDEPDFGLVLDLDESVLARDFGVRQDHLAGRRASQETTALDVDPLTARRFQPD